MCTLAFGSEFLIWFSTMETVLCRVKEKMGSTWGNLGQSPFHGWVVMSPFVELARELVRRLEEDGAPFPYVLV